ncbi:hypothetical protein HBI78_213420 [Parastagonospora nodorum]|nr:hypothetical protein HBI78_213420 [Parastagonospora nodorum]
MSWKRIPSSRARKPAKLKEVKDVEATTEVAIVVALRALRRNAKTFAARGANNSVSTVPFSRFECGGWPLLMQEVGRRGTRRQREGRGEERVRKMDASGFQSTIGFELRV